MNKENKKENTEGGMKVRARILVRDYSPIHKGIVARWTEENITIVKVTAKTVTYIDSLGKERRKAKVNITW